MASSMMRCAAEVTEERRFPAGNHQELQRLSGIGRLLGTMEDSDEDSTTRALNHFALHLMEKLQAIVKTAILSRKLRKGAMYCSYHEFMTGSLYEVWETLEAA